MSLPRYPEYVDSEVRWLGQLPAHWTVRPLWTLFRRQKRVGFEDEELLSVYRDYGVIRKSSRSDNNNKPSEDLSPYQLVCPGDLVINKMKAWQGSVAVSSDRGIVSPAYYVYEAQHEEDARYLHYLMRSARYITGYLSISKGIRINQWDLEPQYHSRMPIVLPPRVEQKAIAYFLDHETAKIDALIAEQEKLLALLAEKRQATISRAVTRGLDPSAPMKDSGIAWLGEVPAHWGLSRLRYLADLNPSKAEIQESGDPLVSFLPMEAIGDDGSIRIEDERLLSQLQSGYTYFRNGDVVVAKITPCFENGKGALISGLPRGYGFGTTELIVVRANRGIQPAFVALALSSSLFRKLAEGAMYGAGGQKRVPDEFVRDFVIGVPPLGEQVAIVEKVSAQVAALRSLEEHAISAATLLRERRTALITAAVTGQIDVRGAVEREEA